MENQDMQAVILAAGRGVRMKNLTEEIPKPMLPIKEKPILAYKLEGLPEEISEVIIVVGYLGDKIREYFGEKYGGKKITYVEQKKLDGTGGAVHLVKDFLNDKFLVIMGDDLYLSSDLKKAVKNDYAVLGYEIEDPSNFGVIVAGEDDYLEEIIEKPQDMKGPALANIGAYVMDKDFFNYQLVDIGSGEFGLPQTLAAMANEYKIKVEKAQDWFPIGKPEDLEKSREVIDNFI